MQCPLDKFCDLLRTAIIALTIENGGALVVDIPDAEVGELRAKIIDANGKKQIRFETTRGSRA